MLPYGLANQFAISNPRTMLEGISFENGDECQDTDENREPPDESILSQLDLDMNEVQTENLLAVQGKYSCIFKNDLTT